MPLERKLGLWSAIERGLLTRQPEMWLMKFHYVGAGAVIGAVLLTVIGFLPQVSLSEYPGLKSWFEVLFYSSLGVSCWWAWRYTKRATATIPSLQWPAFKLFVCHLVCLTMIALPIYCLPAVLRHRLDLIPSEQLHTDLMEWFAGCKCIESYSQRFPRKLAGEPNLRYAQFSCEIWEPFHSDLRRHRKCSNSTNPIADELSVVLQTHAKYTGYTEADRDAVLDFRGKIETLKQTDSAKEFEDHRHWLRLNGVPEQWHRLQNLWNTWCRRRGADGGGCAFEAVQQGDEVKYVRTKINIMRIYTSDAIISDAQLRVRGSAHALFACFLAVLVTALRFGAWSSFFRTGMALIAANLALHIVRRYTFSGTSKEFAETFSAVVIIGFAVLFAVGFVGRVLIGFQAFRRYASVPRLIDVTMAGCLLAPLVPLAWFGQAVLREAPADSNFWLFWKDGDAFAFADLFLEGNYNAWAAQTAGELVGGASLNTIASLSAVLLSLLAAFVLMDTWRVARILPSEQPRGD